MKCFLFGALAVAFATGACSAASMDGLGLDDPQGAAATDDSGAPGASISAASDSGSSSIGTTDDDSGTIDVDASKADAGTVATGDVFSGDGAFTTSSPPNGHHNPGKDCLSCHGNGGGSAPEFSFAGTLYNASGNAVSGAEVRVVDSAGNALSVTTATNGNFYQFAGSGLDVPGHAGIRNATTTDLMTSAVTKGSCNACHCTGSGCATTRLHLP
jgi:hypothetical protein